MPPEVKVDEIEIQFRTYQISELPELSDHIDEAWATIGAMQPPHTGVVLFKDLFFCHERFADNLSQQCWLWKDFRSCN